ncbi:conserved unknown protein [Ectocarpus siliculosus]|uniref:Uncharacterized protein n=1 Tax=Ectocarpus siliculosus TaxID=2880 RepID=D7FYL6_ECTSI|nr:conserved unknown protein [Ectocarpus siliculosus]|eukprot:CBJ32558.1 conserved unknown protein [Ectocarpus siliculosus]
MGKFIGATPQQVLRVQALLKLGVTEEDVRLAAELLRPRTNNEGTKAEWLLSLSMEQMSRLKALEELGVSQDMLEEDRGRILGDLGIPRWGNPGDSMVDAERDSSTSACGPVFRKRQHIEGTAKRWGLAQPTRQKEVEVAKLEDECLSQHLRIQQLELEVAAALTQADK